MYSCSVCYSSKGIPIAGLSAPSHVIYMHMYRYKSIVAVCVAACVAVKMG